MVAFHAAIKLIVSCVFSPFDATSRPGQLHYGRRTARRVRTKNFRLLGQFYFETKDETFLS